MPSTPIRGFALVATESLTRSEQFFAVHIASSTETTMTAVCDLPELPRGRLHTLGRLGVLLDMTAGRTIRANLSPGESLRTVNLRIDPTAVPLTGGQRITAVGHILDVGPATALSQVVATDESGAVVARVLGRFAVLPETNSDRVTPPPPDEPVGTRSLVEALGATLLPDGVVANPDARLGNHEGIMHGGLQVSLAELALDQVVGGRAMQDMVVRYPRGVLVDGSPVRVRAEVLRAGRTITVARASARDTADRELFSAEATYGPLPAG